MEVRYPENGESTYGSGCNNDGPTESQSAPTVKKSGKVGKDKRGKSVDSKKELENGVRLAKPRKKGRTRFHVTPQITYPGVILGHKYCVNQGPPVPARNGWAWKTTIPYGMKVSISVNSLNYNELTCKREKVSTRKFFFFYDN